MRKKLKVTEYKSLQTRVGSVVETDWDIVVDRLKTPYRSAYTREQYLAMGKDAQTAEKEKSGGTVWGESLDGRRKKSSVPYRCALSLDYDDTVPDIVERIANALQGVEYVVYSTIKSTVGAPRVRVIIPTDRLFDADEHQAVGRLICARIGMTGADATMLQNERMMLHPAVLAGQEYIYVHCAGEFLSVDSWLGKYADWRDVAQRPLFEGETVKVARAKAEVKRARETGVSLTVSDPRNKRGIVGAFCECYSISQAIKMFLPDVYEEGKDGRYNYIQGHSKNGVAVIDDVLAYSFHATDPAGMQMVNAYDLVRIHKFGTRDKDKEYTDITRRPSDVAMAALAKADKNISSAIKRRQAAELATNISDDDAQLAIDLGFHTLPMTDMGTAKRLAAWVGETVKFDKDKCVWFRYRDGVWSKESDASFLYEHIEHVADMTVEACIRSGKELDDEVQRYQRYAGMNRNQRAVIACLQALVGVASNDFDADDESINCADGYVSLNDCNSVGHSPDQLCRLQAAAQVNGDINPEAFSFIESVLPDDETRDYVKRLFGYMLGRNNEQKLVILFGEQGNNGKSTFVNAVQAAMGTYAKTGKIDSLLTAKNDGDPERANPSLAMLQNARCVLMHENDYARTLRSAEVKRITGNTPVVARLLRENFVEFTPKFTAVIDVNTAPMLQDAGDDAMKKRVRIIPFNQHFSGDKIDRSLEKKVTTQEWKNAMMMWMLDGRKEFLERGLDDYDGSMPLAQSNLPAEVKEAMGKYFTDSDDVGEYVVSCLDITSNRDDFVTVRDMYENYCSWVAGNPRGINAFSQQAKKRLGGFNIVQSVKRNQAGAQERGYYGIKLLA